MTINFKEFRWLLNKPQNSLFNNGYVKITTNSNTDLWQRTYYGFQNDNAHVLALETDENFTFVVRTKFNSKKLFDQCGVVIYQDSENWFKASIEYEDEDNSKLGSVVTNLGYSDWATTDIKTENKQMWYRLSRRGSDFLIENSHNGKQFHQMRIFHMHKKINLLKFGIYACSPLDSSFDAEFDNFKITENIWKAHT